MNKERLITILKGPYNLIIIAWKWINQNIGSNINVEVRDILEGIGEKGISASNQRTTPRH